MSKMCLFRFNLLRDKKKIDETIDIVKLKLINTCNGKETTQNESSGSDRGFPNV